MHRAAGSDTRHDETRARVLAVALELIAARGFAATSTREISERLGFSKAALYYHFHTKDDLLEALIAPISASLAKLVQRADQWVHVDRRDLLAGYVDLVAQFEEPIRVLSHDPSVRDRPAARAVAPLFERLYGLFSDDGTPDAMSRARLRAALGGIHAVFAYATPDEDRTMLWEAAYLSGCNSLGLPAATHIVTSTGARS